MAAAVFVAGVFRGFSGFGSSAIVMAATVVVLPPVAMIPVCWLLEIAASVAMARAGFREADWRVIAALTVGLVVGGAAGLQLTTSIPVDASKLVALVLIAGLAALQLAGIGSPLLATGLGLNIAALASGVAYGLAGVGGMVVALYVLARRMPARVARGTLVLYLMVSAPFGGALLYAYGMMSPLALARGALLAVPLLAGVAVGMLLFRPRFEPVYRPLCLGFIILVAGVGVVRSAI